MTLTASQLVRPVAVATVADQFFNALLNRSHLTTDEGGIRIRIDQSTVNEIRDALADTQFYRYLTDATSIDEKPTAVIELGRLYDVLHDANVQLCDTCKSTHEAGFGMPHRPVGVDCPPHCGCSRCFG